ncbi:MAG: RdgB/HAM1 family non-canonical purine NTP pyrophosphatase [Oscillospiraceae bacterium]|nr:RdgB/HAM1 family non-canonical purine NTP pyrophosphatase [Oscillospiraceae bacterium]
MQKTKIVFASNNANKIKEMNYLINKNLSKFEINLLSVNDVGFTDEIIENGTTFEENAAIKARAVFEKTGMICFGDDSGLCVDYLNGAPGIYSSRYASVAGKKVSNHEQIEKLLSELKNVPDDKRTAHFYCAIYCVINKNTSFCVSGKCEGFIMREKTGENGFGYDPVFYYPPEKKTFAQLSETEKNKISHRGVAAEQFAKKIVKYII